MTNYCVGDLLVSNDWLLDDNECNTETQDLIDRNIGRSKEESLEYAMLAIIVPPDTVLSERNIP